MKTGEIDRESAHEKSAPFLERCSTPKGVCAELLELHRLVNEQRLLPPSDIADRFSLLLGITVGTIWKLEDRVHELEAKANAKVTRGTP